MKKKEQKKIKKTKTVNFLKFGLEIKSGGGNLGWQDFQPRFVNVRNAKEGRMKEREKIIRISTE